MRLSPTLLAVAAASAALVAAAVPAGAEVLYGVTNVNPATGQQLVTVDSASGAVTGSVALGAPAAGSAFSSIDFRPATGQLYGLASAFDGLSSQLYTINASSGAVTALGGALPAASLIDFNPTVDAVRLIQGGSFGNQNYRVNATTGALIATDGTLAYAAGDVNAGDTPNVRGIGYTNSVPGTVATTTLYDIDVDNDALLTQNPANAGTLQTVGLLGVDLNAGLFGTFNGFDISGATGVAYLTDGPFSGPVNLYTVDLATGIAGAPTVISGLDGRTLAGITAAPIPEPASFGLLGAGATLLLARRRRTA